MVRKQRGDLWENRNKKKMHITATAANKLQTISLKVIALRRIGRKNRRNWNGWRQLKKNWMLRSSPMKALKSSSTRLLVLICRLLPSRAIVGISLTKQLVRRIGPWPRILTSISAMLLDWGRRFLLMPCRSEIWLPQRRGLGIWPPAF